MKKVYYLLFALATALVLGACGSSSKGNFTGEGLLGNIPKLLVDGTVIMPKYLKEVQSHRSDKLSDYIEWKSKFFEENLPEDYMVLLNREISSVEKKMDSYKILNETKYKITSSGVHEAEAKEHGQKFTFEFYVEVEVGNEKVQSGWASLVYADQKSPDDACYALWDKDGNLLGGGRCRQYDGQVLGLSRYLIGSEIDRTKRTYSFSLSYYANTTDADDEAVEKSIAKLEKMDKIAKITLVPWSKYEKISKDLNKDEAN